ncbi:MAG: FtsX-like permease family protein [Candidatus Dormibacteraeota bacterium]|nr:FtsX-like permease family protein [Candidatus Dormibacteraeota bacterium]
MRALRVGLFLGVRAVLRGNRGIAVLTTLMMLLIYVSLLFLPSLIQGAVNRVNDQLVNTLTSDVVITPSVQGTTIQDVDAYLDQIRKTAGVEQATSVFRVGSQISYGSNSGSFTVLAIDPASYARVFTTPSNLFAGRYLSQEAPDQVFVGIGVAGAGQSQIRGYRSSLRSVQVGDQVSITLTNGRQYAFGVLGIFDNQFPLSDGNAFISMAQAQQLLPGIAGQATAVYVKTQSGAGVAQVVSRLSKLRTGMSFQTSADLGSVVQDQVATFTLISDILKAVSLLMAAVTIFMVTYVDLAGRRRQIGIQRAIGITSTAVVISYLLKALAYAIAGVACGYAVFLYVVTPIVQRHPFQFPNGPVTLAATWGEMVRDLVILAAVSAAAALVPAIRSTHLRLLDAIWAT